MKEGKNIPEIRFKGFEGEWEENVFNGVFTNLKNNTLSRAELNYNSGKCKNVHYGDVLIKLGELLDIKKDTLPFITNDRLIEKNNTSILQNGDIIIADTAEDESVGKCTELINIETEEVLSGLHTIPVRPIKPFASKFLGYYMNTPSYHNQLKQLMQGIKVLSVSKSAVKNTRLVYPSSKEEQSQIGIFFQKLDKQITLEQQKHDKLVTLKKAMLEKLFPKEGARVPEIRFEGFEGEWEVSSIKDIFNYLRPDNYIVSTEDYSDEFDIPVLTANKAFILGYTNEKNTYDYPCVIIDDFTLDFKYVDFPFMVKSSALKILTIKNVLKYDLIFIFNLFQTLKFEIMGHARHYIGVVQQMEVLTPSIEEQSQIGSYFQNLDKLISLQQQKIDKLKNIKKACLEKMFV